MERFWQYIIGHKTNPLTWPILIVLAIAAIFYRIGLFLNNIVPVKKVRTQAAVVSVGNITLGGSGKTPMTIHLAKHFLSKGRKVAVAAGGYKRESKETIIGTGKEISSLPVEKTGDELLEMAEVLPDACFAAAGTKREAAKMLDEEYSPDVIIVDDGYQHRRLMRDLDILLIDAARPIEREFLFPLGRLREPLSAMDRADLIIFTKGNYHFGPPQLPIKAFKYGNRAYVSVYEHKALISNESKIPLEQAKGKSAYVFAGIGNFDSFADYVGNYFGKVVGKRRFFDHAPYDEKEREIIRKDLSSRKPDYAVTTRKDWVKIRDFDFGVPIYYLDLHIKFEPAQEAKILSACERVMKR